MGYRNSINDPFFFFNKEKLYDGSWRETIILDLHRRRLNAMVWQRHRDPFARMVKILFALTELGVGAKATAESSGLSTIRISLHVKGKGFVPVKEVRERNTVCVVHK